MEQKSDMPIHRRDLLGAGLAVGAVATTSTVAAQPARDGTPNRTMGISAAEFGLEPSSSIDQSSTLKRAIMTATRHRLPLFIPPGRYTASNLVLSTGTILLGVAGSTVLAYGGGGSLLSATHAKGVRIEGLTLDGGYYPFNLSGGLDGLIVFEQCHNIAFRDVICRKSLMNGATIKNATGTITRSTFHHCANTGLFALDSRGIDISHNHIANCGNNGIQVWRTESGQDGTIVANNRIAHIQAKSGGSGQNGNGINMYRADAVLVTGNHITDCAFSAIRANSSSNCQIVANNCARLGEVALYAEFAFDGAVIGQNLIDDAATGIAVTNFDRGGRLAVVEGNLVRNLRRQGYGEDRRGNGIAVEADSAITGNVVEMAPTAGISIGWGKYMRNVSATGNILRKSRIGIAVSDDQQAGHVLLASNLISDASGGAIRAMHYDRAVGPDLTLEQEAKNSRIALTGNVVV